MAKPTLTLETLKKLVSYDPDTGIFTWLPGTRRAGKVAGCPDDRGYVAISIAGRKYWAHRVAWLYVYGEWPSDLIDHRDRNRSNNRIKNLRMASKSKNGANRPPPSTNTSGFKGVCKHGNGWMVRLIHQGTSKHIGWFKDKNVAIAASQAAYSELFGEFAHV